MKYGYARVSTDGQSVEVQVRQIRAAGCKKNLPGDGEAAQTNRAQLRRAIAQLTVSDVLMVTRFDRLALDAWSLEHAGGDHRQARRIPILGRCVGQYDDGTRPPHAHRARRPSRVRARAEPCPHKRWPRARQGARREVGRKRKLTNISNARRYAAAKAARPCAKSRAATTSATARFRGLACPAYESHCDSHDRRRWDRRNWLDFGVSQCSVQ